MPGNPGEAIAQDKSNKPVDAGLLYTDPDVRTAKVRNKRMTNDGFEVAGHAHLDGVAFVPLLITDTAPHEGPEVDIREIDMTLFAFFSNLDKTCNVSFYGLTETGGDRHLIKTVPMAIGSVTKAIGYETISDPFKFIVIVVVAGFGVSAGSFGATFEEET